MLVWIIDAEQWPRASFRAELIERGYDAVGFVDIASALRELSKRPRAIVLELRGQALSPELLRSLADTAVPVVLLGGSAELSDPLLRQYSWAATLRRPFLLGEVADLLERLVPPETA